MGTKLWQVAGFAVCCISPIDLAAQSQWAFTPFVGVYAPTSDLTEERLVVISPDTTGTWRFTTKQNTMAIYGGKVGFSVSKQVMLEASFGYSPSTVTGTFHDPANRTSTVDTSAHVFLASARALVGLGALDRSTSWHLIIGAGLLSHGGAGYETASGVTDFGGVVGIGAKVTVGNAMAVRLDLEDNLYSAKFSYPGSLGTSFETASKLQNDIALVAGLVVALGGQTR
jgi:hypothetical protein